jgi:hypothetical protein
VLSKHCSIHEPSDLSLEGQHTRAVWPAVVIGSLSVGVAALVQELEVARVDGEGLVVVGSDKLSVGDVVGPGGSRVGLAGEGVVLGGGVGSPLAVEAVGGERAEVSAAAGGALGLDDHEVLVLALDGVDLNSLEEVVDGVGHDDLAAGAEAAGEVANGHAGSVDLAVVTSEEQVHVLAVTDNSLVNGTSLGVGDVAGEERLGLRPAVDVGGVVGGSVRELVRTPLVSENPDTLGLEVEEGRGNSSAAHLGLGSRAELAEVRDGAEADRLPRGLESSGVDELLAVVGSDGEVLEVLEAVLGLGQRTA